MRYLPLVTALATAGLLAACGGSSGSAAPATPTTPTPPASLTLSGVAAKGLALAGATITVKCASGTGTATADATGAYTLSITDGALPCVLEATSADASLVLHSVATGGATDASATANITPLTELLVAQLVGQSPATFMAAADASALAGTVSSTAVSAAQASVVSTLGAAGVDTSALTDIVSGTLVAATGSTTGNAYDQVLDALSAALTTAGTTLADLTTTVATTSAEAANTDPSTPVADADEAALPVELMLRPKADNCAALRSTSFVTFAMARSVTTGASDEVSTLDRFSFDAATLTATYADGSTEAWTAAGTCRYTKDAGQTTIVVAPSGVMVGRVWDAATSTFHVGLALPVQALAATDLAGSWNVLGLSTSNGSFVGNAGTLEVGADGAVASARCFNDALTAPEASCTSETAFMPAFSAHAQGGFNLTSTDPSDPWKDRAFAYRTGRGDLMMVLLNAAGEVNFATRYRTGGLPTVDDVTTVWNLATNLNLVADALNANIHTIASVDANTGSFTRNTQTVGSAVTHVQTLSVNTPRNGYAHRSAATVTASDGSTVNVREMVSLKLRGTGLTAYYLPNTSSGASSNARLGLSVKQ
ncbi:MAG: hypothetical protein KF891_13670 [Rhizobacter sp.]|nr:hypothetical protein [Rhizobacter sp.]